MGIVDEDVVLNEVVKATKLVNDEDVVYKAPAERVVSRLDAHALSCTHLYLW
jgi:hypothetical protein